MNDYEKVAIDDLEIGKQIIKYGVKRGNIVKYDDKTFFLKCCIRKEFLDKEFSLLTYFCNKYPDKFLRYYKILKNKSQQTFILCEYCSYETVDKKSPYRNLDIIKRWCKNTLEILDIIHSEGYYHGDLKSDNLFIGPNGESFIIDFEFTNKKENRFTGWSPAYSSPETKIGYKASDNNHGEKADIWGFGASLYELITQNLPWEDDDFQIKERFLPAKSTNIKVIDLVISDCLQLNPTNRLTVKELLNKYFID